LDLFGYLDGSIIIRLTMQKSLPSIVIAIVILYGIYNAWFSDRTHREKPKNRDYATHTKEHKTTHFQDELSQINTPEYTKQYIIKVINHGSNTLGFKGGVMEGGFADKKDAPKIACYVMELSGKKCTEPYPQDAAMFYTSICGGCHGNDGKGIGGTFPDLTRAKMVGIEKRETFLKSVAAERQNR